MTELPHKDAYLAMYAFLETYYERTRSEDVAALLADIGLLAHGGPADSAVLIEWRDALDRVAAGRIDAKRRLYR